MESGLLLPYDYSVNNSNVYIFLTISGRQYTAYFLEMNFFESCKLYSFSFEKTDGAKEYDDRVSITIVEIIRAFFKKNMDSLVFTCDSSDEKHEARKRLFRQWFNTHSKQEYIKHDKEDDDLLVSIIIQSNNPLRDIITKEFDALISEMNS